MDRAEPEEISRYGQLTKSLLKQITELQGELDKEQEMFENEAKQRIKENLWITKTRLSIEIARMVFEKLRPVQNSFDVIRNHLGKISSEVCWKFLLNLLNIIFTVLLITR